MNKNERKASFKDAISKIKRYRKIRQERIPDGTHYELMWTGNSWFPVRKVNIDIITLDVNYVIIRADCWKEAYLIARELPSYFDREKYDIKNRLSVVMQAIL